MSRLPLNRRVKSWAAAWPAFLIVSTVAMLDHYRVFEVADGGILDSQFSVSRAIHPEVVDSRVVVIAVDEATLKASNTPMGLWHQQYGQLFEWLATVKPQAVGFDIVLPERGYEQRFPGTDRSLMRGLSALRVAGVPVIVAHSIDEHRRPRPIYGPLLSFVDPQYGIGSDVLIPDADRVVRRHTEALGLNGGPVPTFAGQVVRAVGGHYAQGLLNYRIIQDIPIISARTLFEDRPERQNLRETLTDKIVIIGSVLSDIDRLALPLPLLLTEPTSRQPGVIVQANMVSALLNRSLVREPAGWLPLLLIASSVLPWPFSTTALRASAGLSLFVLGVYSLTLGLLMNGWYLASAAALASAFIVATTRLLISTYQAQKAVLIARTRVDAQKEFVSTISHDLRTPVGAMLSTVDLVRTAKDDRTRNQYLAWLGQAATVLEHEIDALLELSKIEDATYRPEEATFNLHALLVELYASVLPLAAAKKLTVSLSVSANVVPIRQGSPTAVARLLQNLASNALKYSKQGCVSIRVYPGTERQGVRFEVEDEAGGIPEDKIAQLFDKYQRFTEEQPGVGLGMAIVHKLVDVMGGSIHIVSSEGQGTTVRIELPLGQVTDASEITPAFPPVVAKTRDRSVMRVLETVGIDLRQKNATSMDQWVEITDEDREHDLHARFVRIRPEQEHCEQTVDNVWHFGRGATVTSSVNPVTLQRLLHLAALDFSLTSGNSTEITANEHKHTDVNRNVLLIDDNEIVRMVWSELLSRAGYTVITATCGAEAIAQLKTTRFDAVILDQHMPDILGTELAREIRKLDGVNPRLPILLATAESIDETEAQTTAITQRLSKTIAPDDLIAMIDETLNKNVGYVCRKQVDAR